MEAIVLTATIRTAMWAVLLVGATYKRYPAFAAMGFLGVVANALLGWAPLVNFHTGELLRSLSGCFGVILIALCVWYAFQGMTVRDKLRHPLSREDLNL